MIINTQIIGVNQGFPLQNSNTSTNNKKNENLRFFKDFFDNKTKTNGTLIANSILSPNQQKRNTNLAANENSAYRRSFRLLENNTTKKAMVQSKKKVAVKNESHTDDLVEDRKESDSGKSKVMVNCYAHVIGIRAEELVKVLESAGIKVDEIDSAINTLETELDMEPDTSEAFIKLLQLIDNQLDQTVSMVNTEGDISGIHWDKSDVIMLNNIREQEGTTAISSGEISGEVRLELSDLLLKLKLKLKEIGKKMEDNEAAFKEEITSNIQLVLKGNMIKATAIQTTSNETNMTAGVEEASASDDSEASKYSDNETTMDTDDLFSDFIVKDQEEALHTLANATNQLKTNESETGFSLDKVRVPIPDREILSQVIENAKILMTADKTEMAMELKPDSLGKISLKVVTEHGIVMAKFVAENQQVKQVLEANMQLLKDSLEKQGLNVQGFSVSVRQEFQSRQGEYEHNGNERTSVSRVSLTGGRMYKDTSEMETHQRIDPYRQNGNSINLTA